MKKVKLGVGNMRWLKRLARTCGSDVSDDSQMDIILHGRGFPDSYSKDGLVYLDGQGCIATPILNIHQAAQRVLREM